MSPRQLLDLAWTLWQTCVRTLTATRMDSAASGLIALELCRWHMRSKNDDNNVLVLDGLLFFICVCFFVVCLLWSLTIIIWAIDTTLRCCFQLAYSVMVVIRRMRGQMIRTHPLVCAFCLLCFYSFDLSLIGYSINLIWFCGISLYRVSSLAVSLWGENLLYNIIIFYIKVQ